MHFYGDDLPAWQAAVRGDLPERCRRGKKRRIADRATDATLSRISRYNALLVNIRDDAEGMAYMEQKLRKQVQAELYGFGLGAVFLQFFLGWIVNQVFTMIWDYWWNAPPAESGEINPRMVLFRPRYSHNWLEHNNSL